MPTDVSISLQRMQMDFARERCARIDETNDNNAIKLERTHYYVPFLSAYGDDDYNDTVDGKSDAHNVASQHLLYSVLFFIRI